MNKSWQLLRKNCGTKRLCTHLAPERVDNLVSGRPDRAGRFWVQQDAMNIRIELDKPCKPCVHFSVAECEYTQCLPFNCKMSDLHLFTVLVPLHFVVVSDLSAMFALMGREGMASTKCLKCDCRISEWKKEKGKVGLDLTKELLKWMLDNKDLPVLNKAGTKVCPLFDLPPE